MTDRHQQKPYPLRVPQSLREKLESAAKTEGRSLNAEIVHRLETTFQPSFLDDDGKNPDMEKLLLQLQKLVSEMSFVSDTRRESPT